MELGDKTFEELGLKVIIDLEHPAAPETRDYTVEIPGKPGAWDFGADIGIRGFEIPCKLLKDSPLARDSAIRNVVSHLFDTKGKPKTMKLVFDSEPEKWYMVRYAGNMPVSRIIGIGQFTIPLTAFDPYAYAESTAYDPVGTYEYDTGLQYDSGLMYDNPTGFQWTYNPHKVGVYNYSHYEAPFQFSFEGDVINPRITNETTGETLSISGQFAAGEKVYVDPERYSVFKVSTSIEANYFLSHNFIYQYKTEMLQGNLLGSHNGKFPSLASGNNSLLFEGGLPNANVQFYWKHRWL